MLDNRTNLDLFLYIYGLKKRCLAFACVTLPQCVQDEYARLWSVNGPSFSLCNEVEVAESHETGT